jgi:sigma-E factor negative regulatory protein RseA
MDRISAFMDGEAAPAESHQALNRLRQDEECRAAWHCFHLVGDVMRGDPVLPNDFMLRLRQKMDQEPTQLAPRLRSRATANVAYAAAAAVAGVALVLTLVLTNNPLRPNGDVASAGPAPAQVAGAETERRAQPAAENSTQLNEYLMAHQEFSPRTALQGVVPYVRPVASTQDGNRR